MIEPRQSPLGVADGFQIPEGKIVLDDMGSLEQHSRGRRARHDVKVIRRTWEALIIREGTRIE